MSDQFALDLQKFVEKMNGNAELATRKIILAVGASLVMRSPVGDPSLWKDPAPPGYTGGRFRANWQHGFNIRPSGTIDSRDKDGSLTIEGIRQRSGQADAFGRHYIVNNLPYARALEYGHSKQAPYGMVGLTVAEFEQYVSDAAKEVNP